MARRYFRHGELPLVLLALLQTSPKHGYQLLTDLSELFAPAYRPSPGTIYPAIESLAAEGLIVGSPAGERTIYELTAVGRAALEERTHVLVDLRRRTGARVPVASALRAALDRFRSRILAAEDRLDHAETVASLEQFCDHLLVRSHPEPGSPPLIRPLKGSA